MAEEILWAVAFSVSFGIGPELIPINLDYGSGLAYTFAQVKLEDIGQTILSSTEAASPSAPTTNYACFFEAVAVCNPNLTEDHCQEMGGKWTRC